MHNDISCIIVDDEQHAIDLLTGRIQKLFPDLLIGGTFSAWDAAVAALRKHNYDVAFIDISIPEKNGLELLELLPGLESEIIFVTAYEEYALDAFAFNTSGYLLKPVNDKELSAAVNKALARIMNRRQVKPGPASRQVRERIAIPNNNGIDYVHVADILYLEGSNRYTRIVTVTNEYLSSMNLGKFEYLVSTHPFFQVHRSYIVNLNYILRYESQGVLILQNKKEIPVSRNLKAPLLDILRRKM